MNDLFKALSDENRRKMLDLLKEGDMTAGEIAGHFEMSKPGISQHLTILKHAELVFAHKKGQFVYYSLNTSVFQDLMKWFMHLQQSEKGK
ncbi:autorepressor SdpR family transcription factor [Metabacillus arenae]|uniref:Winged helix-turn-helix transcriptional regulator n=1 Tax=Metabacillus arenae TaxID=2771434 RepID=A0A926NID7_9BACI|nr:autorepressor SdpR family transcription factor [Metabacillus arenae]MBD1381103.1 winged helix-turn-helix transcriptional regulator [Metabacillus arenae]